MSNSNDTEDREPDCLFFWLGEDGEAVEVSEDVFVERVSAARKAWQDWIDLRDLDRDLNKESGIEHVAATSAIN